MRRGASPRRRPARPPPAPAGRRRSRPTRSPSTATAASAHALDEGNHAGILHAPHRPSSAALRLGGMDSARIRSGRVLHALAWLPGALPLWRAARARRAALGRLALSAEPREARVARRNLELVAPELDAGGARTRSRARSCAPPAQRDGDPARVDATARRQPAPGARRCMAAASCATPALAQGRGVDHRRAALRQLGVADRVPGLALAPFSLVYRVPEKPAGDVFLRLARGGENVQPGAGREPTPCGRCSAR